jgi:hypothetical protein
MFLHPWITSNVYVHFLTSGCTQHFFSSIGHSLLSQNWSLEGGFQLEFSQSFVQMVTKVVSTGRMFFVHCNVHGLQKYPKLGMAQEHATML